MPLDDIRTWLNFATQQMAAESYLDGINLSSRNEVKDQLLLGNNHPLLDPSLTGKTRFTNILADQFLDRYQIIDHHANDATGLSATLMKDTATNTYTLSFRSLEYQNRTQGGDWERDGQGGAAGEIAGAGFALGQLVSMERYYEELKNSGKLPVGATLNVSGYSLGGHLATVFTVLHSNEINHTTIFNGAGIGQIGGVTPVVTEADRIQQLIDAMEAKFIEFDPLGNLTRSGSTANVQSLSWYQPAVVQVAGQFDTTGTASMPTGGLNGGVTRTDGAFQKITQIFGTSVTGGDVQVVANSGMHGPVQSVLIEGQPLVEGLPNPFRDYGYAHSITLIVDSLALQSLFETVDPDLIQTDIENIIKAASPARADVTAFAVEEHTAEGDTLERALDALRVLFVPNASDTTDFNDDTGGFGNLGTRTEFYAHVEQVRTAVSGQTFSIEPLVQRDSQGHVVPRLSATELVAEAQADTDRGLAYRYALNALNPFAVIGVDYVGLGHAADGTLALYDPTTGFGEMTEQYLTDRAAFLLAKLDLTLNNRTTPSDWFALTHYGDVASGFDVPADIPALAREYLFGGDQADTLTGSHFLPTDDHLYGGGGDDSLSGFSGDDYLQGDSGNDQLDGGGGDDRLKGGTGFDTYYYITGDGHDRIEDSDASGVIFVNGQMLVGGMKKSGQTYWEDADSSIKYEMSGTDLVVKVNNQIVLTVNENFKSGQLGIKLIDAPETTLPSAPTIDSGSNGFAMEEIVLPVTGSWIIERVENFNYVIRGGMGSYRIHAGPGNDQLYGGPLYDRLSGRSGQDFLSAFAGDDQLYGWEDHDVLLGGDGHDELYGDLALEYAGNDYLDAGAGSDLLIGGAGDDVLIGGEGNDTLMAEGGTIELTIIPPGDPYLTGFSFEMDRSLGTGDDTLDGGDGADTLAGFAGEDILLGGDGEDVLYGDAFEGSFSVPWDPARDGQDYLDGGVGNDTLFGGGQNDVLIGGIGDDVVWGEGPAYTALSGDDWLEGEEGNDSLFGGLGDDTVVGGAGDDVLYGEASNLPGVLGHDILDGGDGDDVLEGNGGNDVLYGGLGNDQLRGDFLDDHISGGDFLYGDEGDDWLRGEAGNDVLDGGDDDDELQGNEGNDTLGGGAGDDILFGHAGEDTLFGDDGDDLLYGDSEGPNVGIGANDVLDGGDGNDLLLGDGGDDQLFGGAGNDMMLGDTDLDPQITGADWLFGEEGDDQLHGGPGLDILDGGTGNDVYLLNLGDGQDEIFEESVIGDINTLIFGSGIALSMLTFTENEAQGTLLVQSGLGGDSVLVHGFTNNGVNGTGGIQHISVGGLAYSLADLLGLPSGEIIGTYRNDVIKTGNGNDAISAGDGHDTITANGGNDLLIGGAGSDTYVFNWGDRLDSIVDTATATEGNRIRFGAGITQADLAYTLNVDMLTIAYNGTADAVQLLGFNQNTVLGSLVVSIMEFHDGSVVNLADIFPPFTNHFPVVANPIVDQTLSEDASWTFVVPASALTDEDPGEVLTYTASQADGSALPGWISFNAATRTFTGTPDDAQVGTIGLRVTAQDSRNETVSETFNLTVTNVNEAPTVAASLVDQAATKDVPFEFVVPAGAFADVDPGDSLAYSATWADNSALPAWLSFKSSTRTFSGTPQLSDVGTLNVKVTATDTGNLSTSDVFTLTVAHGLNEIIGTESGESLIGTDGHDLIRGLGGSDTLSGLDGNDTLDGGNGDDQLHGGAGHNVLIGGTGADRLEGFTGNDTFQGGSGNDTFYDSYGGQNVYLFGRGDGQDTIYSSFGTVRFAPGVLPVDVTVQGNRDESLTLSINGTTDRISLFSWMNPFNTVRIDRVEFANGTVWDLATLQAMSRTGTAGDDYLPGSNGNDVLIGLGGNDEIVAYDGDDVLDGGPGNDTLRGSFGGDDTYIFGRGYGVDLVQDAGGAADRIQLNAGVLVADVTLLQNGNQIFLSIDQSTTQMMFAGIEQIVFLGGPTWDAAAIASHRLNGAVNSMTGTAGNDTFIVDNTLDTVTEAANQGTDTIQSRVSYTLPDNIENLTLTSFFNVDGSGNLLDNVIIGNSGNNKLAGSVNDYWGGGIDTLQGGLGDDAHTVVGNDDIAIEAPNEGLDTVTLIGDANRGWNYSLPDNVENLIVINAVEVIVAARNFFGNALNNVISGDPGWYNFIDGGLGADTMIGGKASNTYVVDDPGDIIIDTYIGDVEFSVDTVQSSLSYTLGLNVENLTLTGTAAVNGTGNELNNMLTGNSAANVLTGGFGDDTYIIGASDTIVELAGQGTDTVSTDQSYTLTDDLENLTLTGTAAIDATGNALNNVLTGNSGNNVLDGGDGADQLIGGAGDDTYYVGVGDTVVEQQFGGTDTVITDASVVLSTDLENLTLTGSASTNGTGNTSDNILSGNSGANVLTGGSGNDTYVVDGADTIVENPGEGIDTVQASATWVLAADLENLTLTGTSAINGTGNALDNIVTGNSADNVLTGGAGNDTYVADSTDTVIEAANEGVDTVQSSGSFTLGANVENLILTDSAVINGTGNTLNNTLIGNSAANVLSGGAGNDTMSGGAGDDSYVVDAAGDVVTEQANEGIDTVQSSRNFTLGANVENLTLTGTTAINGTGNTLNNVLTGNSAANVLAGGTGNDTYVVGVGDTVTEAASAGTDTVQSAITWTLGANLEHLTLTGTDAINGTGNTLNNNLTGNTGNNVLDGGAGNDTMVGGAGNDTYIVNATGDVTTENANEGIDTVLSAVTRTLGANFEHLTLTGTSAINGTGNTLDNVLTGNSAANTLTGGAGHDTLDGGAGNDTMVGGAGNDTYIVNATGDVTTENANEGIDTVLSAVTRTLGANFENLTLTGTTAINGTGNTLDNVLTGNSAANVLTGGTGNDTYVVGTGDTVTEAASAGTDTVQSAITWTLGANLEHLTLTGTTAINGTGNTLNNTLVGNSATNILTGGAGKDTLTGGVGNDIFDFNLITESPAGVNKDVVTDFVTGSDKIDLAGIDAIAGGSDNAFSFINTGAFTSVAGQLRFHTATNTLQGDIDGNGVADVEIQLVGVAGVAAGDFIL